MSCPILRRASDLSDRSQGDQSFEVDRSPPRGVILRRGLTPHEAFLPRYPDCSWRRTAFDHLGNR